MILKKYRETILALIVLFLVRQSTFAIYLHQKIWWIFAFFVAIDYLIKFIFEEGMANNRDKLIQFYVLSVAIKFILILIFVGLCLYFFPQNRNLFVINVFVFYLFFTCFEISGFVCKLRRF